MELIAIILHLINGEIVKVPIGLALNKVTCHNALYRVVDKNEADLRKGRRSDRMMAINMQLEWEKMENLRSSYEAAGKLEIWKAAYAAFTEQMQTPSMGKDLHSVDDFLYFFEFGEFPEKSLSPSDAVAAAGQ